MKHHNVQFCLKLEPLQVDIDRYYRLAIDASLLLMLENVFSTKSDGLELIVLEELLKGHKEFINKVRIRAQDMGMNKLYCFISYTY